MAKMTFLPFLFGKKPGTCHEVPDHEGKSWERGPPLGGPGAQSPGFALQGTVLVI